MDFTVTRNIYIVDLHASSDLFVGTVDLLRFRGAELMGTSNL